MLALAGGDDTLVTDAGQSANEIAFDLASEGGDRYQGQALVYPDAGHAVGTFPYQPITTAAIDTLGGTGGRRGRAAGRLVEGPRPARPALPVALDDGGLIPGRFRSLRRRAVEALRAVWV